MHGPCRIGEHVPPDSAFQWPRPVDREIEVGDVLLLELGASADGHGYEAQTGKPIVFGPPPPDYAEMFDVCLEAYHAIVAELKPGCTAADLRRAGQVITDRGYTVVRAVCARRLQPPRRRPVRGHVAPTGQGRDVGSRHGSVRRDPPGSQDVIRGSSSATRTSSPTTAPAASTTSSPRCTNCERSEPRLHRGVERAPASRRRWGCGGAAPEGGSVRTVSAARSWSREPVRSDRFVASEGARHARGERGDEVHDRGRERGHRAGRRTDVVIVAGYTGRDRELVQHHIDELAAIGVPPPGRFPAYWLRRPGW